MKAHRYIYGPVSSWRLGRSLGIDPVSGKVKICSMDCVYCQIGRTRKYAAARKVFVPAGRLLAEIRSLPPLDIDHITFSGKGEPTLAKNLGALIRGIRRIRPEPIAVITNGSLIGREDVRRDLAAADLVEIKLDAGSPEIFAKINRPAAGVNFTDIIKGIRKFKARFRGKLALQVMFIKENVKYARQVARLARAISPDIVHLNTPLRPCAVKPLLRNEMNRLKRYFKGLPVISVYDIKRPAVKPLNKKDTIQRRPER